MHYEPPFKKPRFGEGSASELQNALSACVPVATATSTEFWIGVFQSFCKEKSVELYLKSCSVADLNEALCSFYVGLRTKNGEFYKRNSDSLR